MSGVLPLARHTSPHLDSGVGLDRARVAIVLAGLAVGCLAAVLAAIAPAAALVGISVLAAGLAFFLLPDAALLYAVVFVSLSGIRPLPPVGGYHIEIQYLLLPPLLLRTLLFGRKPADYGRWTGLVRASMVLVIFSLISMANVLVVPTADPGLAAGAYGKWAMSFVFLAVLVLTVKQGDRRDAFRLYRALVITIAVYALYLIVASAITGAQLGSTRLSIADEGPNLTGLIADIGIILSLAPLIIGAPWRGYLPWTLPCLALLYLTGSREALISLAAALVVLLAQSRNPTRLLTQIYVLLAAASVALVAFLSMHAALPASFDRSFYYANLAPYKYFAGLTVPDPLAERMYFWATGIHIFLSHPILGIGFGQPLHIRTTSGYDATNGINVAHNSYITVAATQGLVGLVGLIFFVTTIIAVAWSAERRARTNPAVLYLAVGVKGVIVLVLVNSLFSDALYVDSRTMFILFYTLAVAVALPLGKTNSRAPRWLQLSNPHFDFLRSDRSEGSPVAETATWVSSQT